MMHPTPPLEGTTQRRLRYTLALLLCSAVLACQSPGARLRTPSSSTSFISSSTNPPAQATTLAQKDPSMQDITTIELNWGIFMNRYQLDMGSTRIAPLEGGNWMKDAQGNFLRGWYGVTGTPMGGNEKISRLPKTMRVSYYDYQENRFYQLDAELPQDTLYQLFQQRMAAIDSEAIEQRFDTIVIGIYPQGHIMTWVMGGGLNCVELMGTGEQALGESKAERKILQVEGCGHHHRLRDAIEDQSHRHLIGHPIPTQRPLTGEVATNLHLAHPTVLQARQVL